MGFESEDRVTDIVVVRHLGSVENEAVLELGRIAGDDTVADDDILADVAPVPDLAVLADPGGPFDHCAVLDDRALADKDGGAHERFADHLAEDPRLEAELQISRNFGQGFPDVFDVVENDPVFGMVQVEKYFRREHGFSWLSPGRRGSVSVRLSCL